ncbi:MAG: methyltransferase domain protein [Halorubrum sp. J07HR59]|nr:MAG: methyltransferase domain protein [Halorubrum sp. J07HR59]
MIDREAVRDTARYLKQVRPIDPDEICEYIEGTPHPAVVRQTLREQAPEIGLLEAEDGTFHPVDDEPLSTPDPAWTPERLPSSYARVLENALVEEYGPDWHTGASGDELREAIRRLKTDYYYQNDVEYDRIAALGYAIYHLPASYATPGYVLDDLRRERLLSKELSVLDIGAGVGGPTLALNDYVPDDALVRYHAVEPTAAAEILDRFLEETGQNFHQTIHRTQIEEYDLQAQGPWDLILCANVVSELDDPETVLRRAREALAPDGSLVAIAPADLNTSTGLRRVEREVTDDGFSVYGPELRLWDGLTPEDRGWSFDVRPELAVPGFQRRLDDAADRGPETEPGEFVNADVQYTHSILRTDDQRLFDVTATSGRFAKMREMETHLTERIDLLAVKLSRDLSDGGNPLFRVGDGSQTVDHYAVLTRETSLNDALRTSPFGSVLSISNVLALWNDDEAAYNLVVDEETVIDIVAA